MSTGRVLECLAEVDNIQGQRLDTQQNQIDMLRSDVKWGHNTMHELEHKIYNLKIWIVVLIVTVVISGFGSYKHGLAIATLEANAVIMSDMFEDITRAYKSKSKRDSNEQ